MKIKPLDYLKLSRGGKAHIKELLRNQLSAEEEGKEVGK